MMPMDALFHLVEDLTGWRSIGAKVKALPIFLFHTGGRVIIEHIGGDPYWMGHLLMPYILIREGPESTFLLPQHRMWSCCQPCGSPHPMPPPSEVWTPKGMPWEVLARISCAARVAPCTGQQTKGHRLCKSTAFVAQ